MGGGDTILPKSNGRKKVGLKKGFALHDWVLLVRSAKDLARLQGAPIRRSITPDEIAQHNSEHDAWISLHGKVYNITPYLYYHPGGFDIMKPCLGKDASALFEKYHRWVNIDGLIGKLLIGYLGVSKKRDDGNHIAKAAMPPILETQSATKPEPTSTIDMPRPSRNTVSRSLLPPPTEEDEDDKNPWDEAD